MRACTGEEDDTEGEAQGEELETLPGYLPGHTPRDTQRSFTDIVFVPVFAVALLVVAVLITTAVQKGAFQRLVALPNKQGQLCGIEGRGPYLFFCREGDDVDLSRQVCLQECPAENDVDVTACERFGGSLKSYPSAPVAGMLCMPSPARMVQDVRHLFASNAYFKTLFDVLELSFDWEQPMLAALLACCFSHTYLLCLSRFAEAMLQFGLVFLVVVPTTTGLLFLYMSLSPDVVAPRSFAEMISTGSTHADGAIGCWFMLVALLAACMAAVRANSIDTALPNLEEAAHCFRQLPSVGLEPWISAAVQVALLLPGVLGLLMLNMSGELTVPVDFSHATAIYHSDFSVVLSLMCYVVVLVWIFELKHALSQFATMLTAELWYFRKPSTARGTFDTFDRGACDILLGYQCGLIYHLGSLIYGSLLCTFLRLPRMVASFMVQSLEGADNPVTSFFQRSCQCCLAQAERLLTTVTSLGYCDIAMNSTSYRSGAEHAMSLLEENGTGLVAGRIAGTISLIGAGLVSLGTALSTWLVCSTVSRYNSRLSEHYVADKRAVMVCAAIVGALLSLPFMHLF
ncbi:SLC44A1, partial [Symbiodinium natans]